MREPSRCRNQLATTIRRHGAILFVVTVVAATYGAGAALIAHAGIFASSAQPLVGRTRAATTPARRFVAVLARNGYRVRLQLAPNRAGQPETMLVRAEHDGEPAVGVQIRATISMAGMLGMGSLSAILPKIKPGTYRRAAPTLMAGRWQLRITVSAKRAGQTRFTFVDQVHP